MDRVILFRGKCVETGEWVFGFYFRDEEGSKIKHWTHDPGNRIDEPPEYHELDVLVDDDTVGQYIGRDYEDGVKMFEGDIVKVVIDDYGFAPKCRRENINGTYALIGENKRPIDTHSDGIYKWLSLENTSKESIKLLGNIYDNKELLNG